MPVLIQAATVPTGPEIDIIRMGNDTSARSTAVSARTTITPVRGCVSSKPIRRSQRYCTLPAGPEREPRRHQWKEQRTTASAVASLRVAPNGRRPRFGLEAAII
jgi:hypothetical protein